MKHLTQILSVVVVCILLFSCDNELHITLPQGPAGLSAYDLWVQGVENGAIDWPKDRTGIEQFYLYMKGQDGKDGQDGKSAYEEWKEHALTGELDDPHNPGQKWDKNKVEKNDFWYFLTGADGKDGKNGSIPVIGENGNWWIDGVDTGKPSKGADGTDGTKIEISDHNTWVLDGVDTGVPVTGADGADGKEGSVVTIGENGNWHIDGKDTTIPARGKNGTNGADGTNGVDGKSAYEVWKEQALTGELDDPHNPGQKWDENKTDKDDFWYYLRGKTGADGQDGQDGADGKAGSEVTIGANGNWFIDGVDTGIPARGQDGENGATPVIGDNGNWWIDGKDTGKPAIGQDGADGQDGQDGNDGSVVTIGSNGNWYIDGVDTGVPAFGQDGSDGEDGANGQSAYALWKIEAESGKLTDPKTGEPWDRSKNSTQDFWEYLTGADGAKGDTGSTGESGASAYELWKIEVANGLLNPHDEAGGNWPTDRVTLEDFWEYLRGKDGKDGETIINGQIITIGVPNVISQYVNQEHKEFVNPADGSVLFIVYNEVAEPSSGAKVKGLPGLDPEKEFTADMNGEFKILKEDLPEGKTIEELTSSVEVTYVNSKGETVTGLSGENTYVPNRIRVRLVRANAQVSLTNATEKATLRAQRFVNTPDAKWENIPTYLEGNHSNQTLKWYELTDQNDPTSYDEKLHFNEATVNVTSSIFTGINRQHILPSYLRKPKSGYEEWDREEHYYIAKLESYYGESPVAPLVVQVPPVQYVPGIKAIEDVKGYNTALDIAGQLNFIFNKGEIDFNHLYKAEYDVKDKNIDNQEYEYCTPLRADLDEFLTLGFYKVECRFTNVGGGSQNQSNNALGSYNNNTITIAKVGLSSTISIYGSGTSYFIDPGKPIGRLSFDPETNKLTLVGYKDDYMNHKDITGIDVELQQ